MREASIHLLEKDLIKVLKEVFDVKDSPLNWDCEQMAKEIMIKARRLSATHRLILVDKDKIKGKTDRLQLTGRTEASDFAAILFMVRKKFKHRGIAMLKAGDRDWLMLKEIAALAVEFVNEFQLPPKEGFKIYCTLGLERMKNFSLLKFRQLHPVIFKVYEAIQELQTDRYENKTREAYDIYTTIVMERVGIMSKYKDNPEKYVAFKKAAETAVRLKISIKVYIKAQFAALEWANSIPDPTQLYGDKAEERVIKYCYENNISLRVKPDIDLSKIKGT